MRRRTRGEWITASEWNEIVDAVEWTQKERRAQRIGAFPAIPTSPQPVVALIRNDSAAPVPRFGVLGISGPLIDPEDDVGAFQHAVRLVGAAPSTDRLVVPIAVVQKTVDPGVLGPAILDGMSICRLNVTDPSARFAAGVSGETGFLETASGGSIEIIWREGNEEGEEWAIVRLGVGAGAALGDPTHVVVISTQISSSPKRWLYTIKRGTTGTSDGLVTGTSGAASVVAYNNMEDSSAYQYGQSLTQEGATLTVNAVPNGAPVHAFATGLVDGSDVPIYRFTAPNPMSLSCG